MTSQRKCWLTKKMPLSNQFTVENILFQQKNHCSLRCCSNFLTFDFHAFYFQGLFWFVSKNSRIEKRFWGRQGCSRYKKNDSVHIGRIPLSRGATSTWQKICLEEWESAGRGTVGTQYWKYLTYPKKNIFQARTEKVHEGCEEREPDRCHHFASELLVTACHNAWYVPSLIYAFIQIKLRLTLS